VKWIEEAARQLEVASFMVNSVFCVHSNAFRILSYARRYSASLGQASYSSIF